MADNTYYGAGTYGEGAYQPYQLTPDSLGDPETVGSPDTVTAATAFPDSTGDTDTVGSPDTATATTAMPDPAGDTEATGAPTASSTASTTPDPAQDPETLDPPTLTVSLNVAPDPAADTETFDVVTVSTSTQATPTSLGDAETVTGPTLLSNYAVVPDSATDTESVADPAIITGYVVVPDSLSDPDTISGPDTATAATANPDSTTDPETLVNPSVASWNTLSPDSVSDPDTVGAPDTATTSSAAPDPAGDTDALGEPALDTGTATVPDSITDTDTVGAPDTTTDLSAAPDPLGDPDALGDTTTLSTTASSAPDTLSDPETVQGPALGDSGSNLTYGSGVYNQGIYYGVDLAADQSVNPGELGDPETLPGPQLDFAEQSNPNYGYGDGPYGVGTYFGTATADDAIPLFAPRPLFRQDAQHIMGIGPWSSQVAWRGAKNYGAAPGRRPARPVVGLPPATSKSFTLRLNEGGEARADYSFTRDTVIIPEKMHTDLWWRRREPTTGAIEVIGRFNTASADLSTTDTGIDLSANWVDYRTLLGDRMVLSYDDTSDPANPQSLWDKGTPLVTIMRFAVPANMNLDLSNLDPSDPAGLGTIISPFEIPLGSTIAEVFDNLNAIAAQTFEWWVQMPSALDAPPKLQFVSGTRGADRGVVLADTGGPSPIASWSMTGSADAYANSLYFIGEDGGDVAQLPDDIAYYGQRDASDSDSSVKGTTDASGNPYLLDRAARKRLAVLSDQRPTYQVVLAPGWWRGLTHIDVGDTVRIVIRLGEELLTGTYRVTELACAIDATNGEQVTLTLGRPPTSGNPRSRRSALARIVARLKNYERKDTSS